MNICIPSEVPSAISVGYEIFKDMFDSSAAGKYVYDLYLSSTSCYLSIFLGVVYSFIYIYLMSAFAEQISWFCIFVLEIFLLGSSLALYMIREDKMEGH